MKPLIQTIILILTLCFIVGIFPANAIDSHGPIENQTDHPLEYILIKTSERSTQNSMGHFGIESRVAPVYEKIPLDSRMFNSTIPNLPEGYSEPDEKIRKVRSIDKFDFEIIEKPLFDALPMTDDGIRRGTRMGWFGIEKRALPITRYVILH